MRRPSLEVRSHVTVQRRVCVTTTAVLVGLALGALLLAGAGVDPIAAYSAMARAAFFGGAYALSDTAVKATPLLICGLGCALAFRMRLWNVGAEGQLLLGAWAATGVATAWMPGDHHRVITLVAMAVAAFTVGAALAAVAGLLKARFQVSEILSTLMLVYVVAHWNNYWIFGPWSEGGFPLTPLFPVDARLWRLADLAEQFPSLAGLTVHVGFGLAIAAAAAVWILLYRTRLGFEISVVGDNPGAAASAGMPVARNIVIVLALSGGLAGLAGMVEVSGVVFRLQERFSPGYGFTAIIVAWLGHLHPGAIVAVALLFGGMLVGSREVQPTGIASVLQGLMLFSVVGGELFLRYRVTWRSRG